MINAHAAYNGDKPLTVSSNDIITGDLIYTIGSSYYSGMLYPGSTYEVHHNISLPVEATITYARVYVYWTWSAISTTGRYPDLKLTFNSNELSLDTNYTDRKGYDPYDYPGGTWAYDITDLITGSGTYNTVIENIGPDTSKFAINGVGLVLVYTDPDADEIEYWIAQGCDYLSSKDESGLTPEEATTQVVFPGSINSSNILKAVLTTVVQSGNYDNNSLMFNFKNWTGIYNGTPYTNLDVDERNVRDCLICDNNTVNISAVDDYMVPSNAFLVLTHNVSESTSNSTNGGTVVSLNAVIVPEISIEVTPLSLNFGTLRCGEISADHQLLISSKSTSTIKVTSEVSDTAQDLYVRGMWINNTIWSDYQTQLVPDATQNVDLQLRVPVDYESVGEKKGTLTFWAQQISD